MTPKRISEMITDYIQDPRTIWREWCGGKHDSLILSSRTYFIILSWLTLNIWQTFIFLAKYTYQVQSFSITSYLARMISVNHIWQGLTAFLLSVNPYLAGTHGFSDVRESIFGRDSRLFWCPWILIWQGLTAFLILVTALRFLDTAFRFMWIHKCSTVYENRVSSFKYFGQFPVPWTCLLTDLARVLCKNLHSGIFKETCFQTWIPCHIRALSVS